MNNSKRIALLLFVCIHVFIVRTNAQQKIPLFKVVALYENGGHHIAYSKVDGYG